MNQSTSRIPAPGGFEQVYTCGQMWRLSRVGPGIRQEFAAWVEAQSYARLERARPRIARDEYARRLAKLDAERDCGAYDWGFELDEGSKGSAVTNALGEGDGPAKMMQLLLREHHGLVSAQQIGALFADKPDEIQAAARRALDPTLASPADGEATKTSQATTPTTSLPSGSAAPAAA